MVLPIIVTISKKVEKEFVPLMAFDLRKVSSVSPRNGCTYPIIVVDGYDRVLREPFNGIEDTQVMQRIHQLWLEYAQYGNINMVEEDNDTFKLEVVARK